MKRRSDDFLERLKKLHPMDKGQAIVRVAAQRGLSQKDLIGLVVQITGMKTADQARVAADVWAPLLDMSPKRFEELAADFF